MGEIEQLVGKSEVKAKICNITDLVGYLSQYNPKINHTLRQGEWIIAVGDKDDHVFVSNDDLFVDFDDKDIWVCPVVDGDAPAIILAFGITSTWAVVAVHVGVALAMMALSAMLAPSLDTPEMKDEPGSNTPSAYFNGAANVQEPGATHPIVYGFTRTGSVVIATALDTEIIV